MGKGRGAGELDVKETGTGWLGPEVNDIASRLALAL